MKGLLLVLSMSLVLAQEVRVSLICMNEDTGQFQCMVDDNDSNSVVTWRMVTSDGTSYDLGTCRGNMMSCTSTAPSLGVSVNRWYSWSWVSFTNAQTASGATLTCSATHFGQTSTDQCTVGRPQAFESCCRGQAACNAKGWTSCGSINGLPVCCPEGQGLILSSSSCQCNPGSG